MTSFKKDLYSYFDLLNERFFDNKLPKVKIQDGKYKGKLTYYKRNCVYKEDGIFYSVIFLNLSRLRFENINRVLTLLAQEMCRHLQYEQNKRVKHNYFDKYFSDLMDTIGLTTSVTGRIGGAPFGQTMDNYVKPNGVFAEFLGEINLHNQRLFDIYGNNLKLKTTKTNFIKKECGGCEMIIYLPKRASVTCNKCNITING